MWNLSLWHAGCRSLTRDQTQARCVGSWLAVLDGWMAREALQEALRGVSIASICVHGRLPFCFPNREAPAVPVLPQLLARGKKWFSY